MGEGQLVPRMLASARVAQCFPYNLVLGQGEGSWLCFLLGPPQAWAGPA